MKRGVLWMLLTASLHFTGQAQTRYFVCTLENLTAVESFVVAADDEALLETADAQLALPVNQRSKFISGHLYAGDGGFNSPWNWHIGVNEWMLVDNSIEICDGRPSDVENDLSYWIDTVQVFCPWGSYIEREIFTGEAMSDAVHPSLLVYNGGGSFTVQLPSSSAGAELSVYHISGQKLLHIPAVSGGMEVYLPGLIRGMYIAVLRDQQSLYRQKLLLLQ